MKDIEEIQELIKHSEVMKGNRRLRFVEYSPIPYPYYPWEKGFCEYCGAEKEKVFASRCTDCRNKGITTKIILEREE